MEFKNISTINTYDLIKNYLSRENISSHITKHLTNATLKPVDDIYSNIVNDSFIILKFQESQNRSNYFKYLVSSNEISPSTFDRIDISSSIKNITRIDFNHNSLYFIISIGSSFTIVTPNNKINYETLTLKESIKFTNEIGKKYIIKIACGENHCLFLTHAGMVYTMGDNSYGQLGIGQNNITKESKEGLMVKELLNYRINDISSGRNHCFCFGIVREMTKDGSSVPNNNMEFDPKTSYFLFGWGDNSCFQIGIRQLNRNKLILKPTKIFCTNNYHNAAIVGEELINICCGLNFTALLFRNGKLLTFGDNQYNQLIYKENDIFPNFAHNYLPKKIGKISKIITSGNSLMLISEFNKIIIFGKFNEPNINEIKIIDLVDNYESNKYIFNDKLLKIIYFNNEELNKNIIGEIQVLKTDEFLVNTKKGKIIDQTTIKERVINNNYNTTLNNNKVNINNYSNANTENNNNTNINNSTNSNNKILTEKNINVNNTNKNTEITPNTIKHNKLKINPNNNNLIPNSAMDINKKYANFKNVAKKFQNVPKNKYKNSYTTQSSNNEALKKIYTFNINQNKNQKSKIEPKNGAEEKNNIIKNIKSREGNGSPSPQNKNNNLIMNKGDNNKNILSSSSYPIANKDNNIILNNESSDKELNKNSNNNLINDRNENGNTNQNTNINKTEIDNKTFLNKNILKNNPQKAPIKNRYEEYNNNYDNENHEKEIKKDKINNITGNKLNIEEEKKKY